MPTVRRADAAHVIDLRHAVLRQGLPRASAIFPGDDDGRHWVAEHDGAVIGCVTVMAAPRGEAMWQLRGMAVADGWRGQGVGGQLLDAVHAEVAAPMWCNARLGAVPFYAAHGWAVVSEVFDIPTAGPHHVMTWSPR